ncbi:MAG: hypothetical protein AB6733_20415 [Clostridiaceae bacterium]
MREAAIVMFIITIIFMGMVLILPINLYVKAILEVGSIIICYMYYGVFKKRDIEKP